MVNVTYTELEVTKGEQRRLLDKYYSVFRQKRGDKLFVKLNPDQLEYLNKIRK